MSLFNKKEDVLDTELTQYGKKKLSMGDFTPVYYAFYDDEIVYDANYVQFSESHLDIRERIKDGITFKPQYTFASLSRNDKEELENELGNSSLISNYLPAWNIKVLNNEFYSCSMIPQSASMTITYSSRTKSGEAYSDYTNSEFHSKTFLYDDDSYLEISRDYILLDIQEINGSETIGKDKFEIEFYIEENGTKEKISYNEIQDYLEILVDNELPSQIICEKITDRGSRYENILPRCNNYNGSLILGKDSIDKNIYKFNSKRGEIC